MRQITYLIILFFITACATTLTDEDSVQKTIFYVDNTPVSTEEFIFSFKKSFTGQDSIDEQDINDYLQLFINYKLKVAAAKDAGYDTLNSYLAELSVYQEQLKESYRTSEKILDHLKKEAYQRLKKHINVSHILMKLPPNSEDTVRSYTKLMELKERAATESFAVLARKYSEDPSVKINEGEIGYFTAFQMVYPFESAAYSTPVGQISKPIRTEFGYHILKILDVKEINHRLEFEQLFISSKNTTDSLLSSNKIFEAYEMLNNGLTLAQVVESLRSDNLEIQKGKMPSLPELQKVGYQLAEEGDVSDPVQTQFGWHIILLKEKKEIPPYNEIEDQLTRMVRRTDRVKSMEDDLMTQLIQKYQLKKYVKEENIIEIFGTKRDSSTILFSIQDTSYTLQEYKDFLNDKSAKAGANSYNSFIKNEILKIEDQQVVQSNPDLKWLLKEYEEGMLLFNIMEDSVWNKAVSDTTGFIRFVNEASSESEGENNGTGNNIIAYQDYLEKTWVQKLREKYQVRINQPGLKAAYEKLLD